MHHSYNCTGRRVPARQRRCSRLFRMWLQSNPLASVCLNKDIVSDRYLESLPIAPHCRQTSADWFLAKLIIIIAQKHFWDVFWKGHDWKERTNQVNWEASWPWAGTAQRLVFCISSARAALDIAVIPTLYASTCSFHPLLQSPLLPGSLNISQLLSIPDSLISPLILSVRQYHSGSSWSPSLVFAQLQPQSLGHRLNPALLCCHMFRLTDTWISELAGTVRSVKDLLPFGGRAWGPTGGQGLAHGLLPETLGVLG